ncbi:MAG TPA: hypothetical protein VG675_15545 [Bryobacteraceae bacterium]|nr:hypothetical protein [Bryobacteraceae bacterium]
MRGCTLLAIVCGLAILAWPADKKKKEEETQTLQLPKELPSTVVGQTHRLMFYVTPLSAKGLLSQQVRDALKALSRQAKGGQILKIRAFVAGSGDVRRVRDLVSETFTGRKQPLPVLTLVQSGGLPMAGAQVVLEAVVEDRKERNPKGLAFLSAQAAYSANPIDPVAPLAEKSVAALNNTLAAAGSEPADVLRITCLLSSLENVAAVRKVVAAEYPGAAQNYLQTQRAPARAVAACEAVARLRRDAGAPVRLLNPSGTPATPGASELALVSAPQLVFTSMQASFGYQEQDVRLAFERLQKDLEQSGVSAHDVIFAHYYPLSLGIANQVRKIEPEFMDAAHPPASTLQIFEGLPAMDAGFAVDVVAVKP